MQLTRNLNVYCHKLDASLKLKPQQTHSCAHTINIIQEHKNFSARVFIKPKDNCAYTVGSLIAIPIGGETLFKLSTNFLALASLFEEKTRTQLVRLTVV